MTEHLPERRAAEERAVGPPSPRPGIDYWRDEPADEGSGFRLSRIVGALLRQKWVVVAAAAIGAGAGYLAYHSVDPVYETRGELFINSEDAMGDVGGPISQGRLLTSTAWDDLIKSSAVLDSVAVQERLYLIPDRDDEEALEGFRVNPAEFRLGRFRLKVSEDGRAWRLLLRDAGRTVGEMESGRVGEPVGQELGFLWTPPPAALTPGRTIDFQVIRPRDAALRLARQVDVIIHGDGSFITLALAGERPERITSILTAVMERHEEVAANLKRAKLDELTGILEDQLASVRQNLDEAENALQSFQIRTITLPTAESAPIAPGLEQTRGPVMSEYFNRRLTLDQLQHDVQLIRRNLASLESGGAVTVENFNLITAVQSSTELKRALDELVDARAELRALLRGYTEEHRLVRNAQARVDTLEMRTIPALGHALVADLEEQAADLDDRLESRTAELREIPTRAIEEQQLERRVELADRIYRELQINYEAADLAARSSIPDVEILARPEIPQVPSRDERIRFAGLAFLGILGAGILGVILLDRFDPRIRDPLEVQDDIGLEILGAIPRIRLTGKVNTGEVTEAFREIRMRLEFAYGASKPLILAVTSPDTGEGKTLVSANLAIAFSQLKHRTLLIDADTRRGDVHELLDVGRRPGLTDLLAGRANGDAMVSTSHSNLWFIGSGSRVSSSPELLSGSRMQDLMAQVKQGFDVVIIDSPPMAAGGDAFVLGAHAGAVLVVMRSGSTHRQLAKAKMEAFYRLPVRILGAVINDIEEGAAYGSYRYYSYYLPGYRAETEEEDDAGRPSTEPVAG